jgi:hypothetical protein
VSIEANDAVYGRIDWDRVERFLWDDLGVQDFRVTLHSAEHATLYRASCFKDGRFHEALDWHLHDAVLTLMEELGR